MCIVIDPGCIPVVFDSDQSRHDEFRPVLQWVTIGAGKMVIGGTTYKSELGRLGRFVGLISELRKAGRALMVDDAEVDRIQHDLEIAKKDPSFDDAHLVAIAIVAGVMLICTQDARACKFIKDRALYPKGSTRPKIYSSARNRNLITARHITSICRK